MVICLLDMKPGTTGIVSDIRGGMNATSRVRTMGIRTGKKIKKLGPHFRRGPQTVLIDNFKVAIGYGMASKIFVEVD